VRLVQVEEEEERLRPRAIQERERAALRLAAGSLDLAGGAGVRGLLDRVVVDVERVREPRLPARTYAETAAPVA